MESPQPVIQLERLSKTFGRGNRRVRAVRELDLEIAPRQVFGFLGPNGAGKTTTIRLLMDLIRPTEGTARLFGEDVNSHPGILRRAGALVEDATLYGHLSASDNLRVLSYVSASTHLSRIDSLLEQVGLSDAGDRRVSGYSTGMKQRLGIAAALLTDPDLVILDEPTNGLDPAGIVEMRELIRALVDVHGKTVFLSSHLLSEVEQTCDRVAIIHQGSIIKEGKVSDLLSEGAAELRIQAQPLDQAAEILRLQWEVTIDGDWLSMNADTSESSEIIRQLVNGGVDVMQVIAQQQSLEAYFMSVTGANNEEDSQPK
jgi:ABC-2 type transport system ATP-binding protein